MFGCKNQNIYLKKTGEMLYYAGFKGDYKLPNVIKKITKKTSWRSGVNTLRLNKNIKKVNCKYLPFGSVVSGSYLEDIYVAKYSKVKFQNIKELEAGYIVKIHVPKNSVAKAKKDFKKVSNVKVVASSK
ncbi:hypothetical protein [Eubacterium xylanophilum]|uniref:hypothetical protein n=1 Tax=Eubacterium xylanophilum TaxID=39497 RepID=UPI00047AFEDC|nr:hypothetical protein [Eubacterium xylanophilum]